MQKLLKISQQTFWQVLGKVVASSSTILILSLVTRNYGVKGTGELTLALLYLAYFATAVDAGINGHLMPKFLSPGFSNVWRKLLGLRLLLGVFLMVIAVVGIIIWPTSDLIFKQLVLLGIIGAILEPAVWTTCSAVFQAKLRYELPVSAWIAGSLVELLVIFVVVKNGLALSYLMVGVIAGWLVMIILPLFLIRKYIQNLWPIFDFRFIKTIMKASWPISLTLVINLIYFRFDSFLLSVIKNFSEVGIYNLSYSIFQSILVLPAFIMNSFYPMMLETLKNQLDRFHSQIKIAAAGLLGFSLVVSLVTYFLSPVAIQIIAGPGFEGSITSLRILSFGLPAYFISALLMWVYISKNMYKKMLLIYMFGLGFNLLANLIFIPQYGFIAASWITGISEYLILILQIIILSFPRKRESN